MRAPPLLLAAALLAGCAAEPSAPAPDAAAPGPATLRTAGCENAEALFAVPAEGLQDAMPPGYRAGPHPADPTGALADVLVFALRCAEARVEVAGEGRALGELRALFVNVGVTPPEGHRSPDALAHGLVLAVVAEPAEAAGAFAALGYPARAGTMGWDATPTPAPARSVAADARAEGFAATLRSTAAGPAQAGPDFAVRHVVADAEARFLAAVDVAIAGAAAVVAGAASASLEGEPDPLPEGAPAHGFHVQGYDATWTAVSLPPS